jgi:hypothetical protein
VTDAASSPLKPVAEEDGSKQEISVEKKQLVLEGDPTNGEVIPPPPPCLQGSKNI